MFSAPERDLTVMVAKNETSLSSRAWSCGREGRGTPGDSTVCVRRKRSSELLLEAAMYHRVRSLAPPAHPHLLGMTSPEDRRAPVVVSLEE